MKLIVTFAAIAVVALAGFAGGASAAAIPPGGVPCSDPFQQVCVFNVETGSLIKPRYRCVRAWVPGGPWSCQRFGATFSLGPNLHISPGTFIGTTPAGENRYSYSLLSGFRQPFTVTNDGNRTTGPLWYSTSGNGPWIITTGCFGPLAPGATCEFSVTLFSTCQAGRNVNFAVVDTVKNTALASVNVVEVCPS